jgi:hypothetical protein
MHCRCCCDSCAIAAEVLLRPSHEGDIRQFVVAVASTALPAELDDGPSHTTGTSNSPTLMMRSTGMPIITGTITDPATWDPIRRVWNRAS